MYCYQREQFISILPTIIVWIVLAVLSPPFWIWIVLTIIASIIGYILGFWLINYTFKRRWGMNTKEIETWLQEPPYNHYDRGDDDY